MECVRGGGRVVQSKTNKAKFQIQERLVDNEIKYVLPKIRFNLPAFHLPLEIT
jgi:hypothetical protein